MMTVRDDNSEGDDSESVKMGGDSEDVSVEGDSERVTGVVSER